MRPRRSEGIVLPSFVKAQKMLAGLSAASAPPFEDGAAGNEEEEDEEE